MSDRRDHVSSGPPAGTPQVPFESLSCVVLTLSDTRTAEDDTTGDYLEHYLRDAGHHCVERAISRHDIYQIRRLVSAWVADPAVHVVLCNGGTGFGHDKSTPAAVLPLLDRVVPGFGELFRALSFEDVGSAAVQSDALAGLANNTLVVCLPGSPRAVRLGWERLLRDQLDTRTRPCNFATGLLRAGAAV